LTSLVQLGLNSNRLTGAIPGNFSNLTSLEEGELNLGWNSLYASDGVLDAFLDTKSGEDWSASQTVAPDNVIALPNGGESATVSWDTIEFTGESGGYRVGYSQIPGGPYTDAGTTADKLTTSHFVDGLEPGVTYYFTVASETGPHANNLNRVVSESSAESMAGTEFINEETSFEDPADYRSNPELLEETPFTFLQSNDGFDEPQDAFLATADADISNIDALTLTSSNASWRNEEDDGVFLGLSAWGDFTAEAPA
jgi:hypothetical protein